MAISISNESNQVKIDFGRKVMWVPKPFRVTFKEHKGRIWINSGDNGVAQGRSDIMITYSEVTSPTSVDIAALAEALSAYNNQSSTGTFTDTDLSAGVLTITHNLGTTSVVVVIRDPAGQEVIQPNVVVDSNSLTVDFGGSIGAGTFTWFVLTK